MTVLAERSRKPKNERLNYLRGVLCILKSKRGVMVNHVMIASLCVATSFCCWAGLTCEAFAAVVTTVAGSGQAGFTDGPSMKATFMQPYGIAVAKNGDVYVADAAAQRIRLINNAGFVTTVAGGGQADRSGLKVDGGYVDGPVTAARFNFPTGVAQGASGELYVADSENRCIRLIQNGSVSTYAGMPSAPGNRNGPRNEAQFLRPTSLAMDRHGNLFVADPETGLRRISRDGTVSTVSGAFVRPFGVAISPNDDRYLFVADDTGLTRIDPNGKIETFTTPDFHAASQRRELQADRPIGFPFGVAALDDNSAVFTDVRTNTVRSVDFSWAAFRILGGQLGSDPEDSGGGHNDGGPNESRFDGPSGIAARADGSFLVADGGSKRIRLVSHVDDRSPVLTFKGLPSAEAFPTDAYNIVFIGNSIIWWNTEWSESIPGKLEEALTKKALSCQRRVRVIPALLYEAKLDAQAEYAELLASTYHPKMMILALDAVSVERDIDGKEPTKENAASWQGHLQDVLRNLNRRLAGEGVKFSVAAIPFSFDLAPAEQIFANYGGSVKRDTRDLLEAPIVASGVPLIDTWESLAAEERSPAHVPLYGTRDAHFAAHGRAFVASIIARHIPTPLICAT